MPPIYGTDDFCIQLSFFRRIQSKNKNFYEKIICFFMHCLSLVYSSCRPSVAVVKVHPEAPVNVRPAAPCPGYVWVDGDWVWQKNHYGKEEGVVEFGYLDVGVENFVVIFCNAIAKLF